MSRHVRWTALVAVMLGMLAAFPPGLARAFTPSNGSLGDVINSLVENGCSGFTPLASYTLESICTDTSGIPNESTAGSAPAALGAYGLDTSLYARMQQRREGQADSGGIFSSTGDAADGLGGRLGLWASYEFERYNKDVTTFESGFQSNQNAGIFGIDYRFDTLVLGAAFHVTGTSGDYRGAGGGKFSTDSGGAAVYASFFPMPGLFVDTTIGYTRKDYETARIFTLLSGAAVLAHGTHRGETTGNEYRFGVNSGYDFTLARLTVGPRLGLNYVLNTMKGYTENDVSAANGFSTAETGLELIYDNQEWDSLTLTAGVYASYALSTGIGVFLPQVTALYVHEFRDDQRNVFFRFAQDVSGSQFHFKTDPPDRDYAVLSAGLLWQAAHGIAPYVNYRVLVGYKDHVSHTVTGGVRFQF